MIGTVEANGPKKVYSNYFAKSSTKFRLVSCGVGVLASALALTGCSSNGAALTPPQLLNAGIAAFSQGSYQTARADYKKVLQHDPSNKYGINNIAWYDLGVLDQNLGNASAAASEYQQALLIDPKYSAALYNLAVLETNTNPSEAINLYRQARVLSPTNPNVLWNLGLLLYKTGHIVEGRSLLKSAIKIAPSIAAKLPKGVKL